MALQGTENVCEDTNLAENEREEFSDSFVCHVCLDLLYKPIVLSCGHISCFWCVHHSMNPLCESHCSICQNPYHHFPTICWMLHYLLLKMYPVAYKRREIQTLEVEKKEDYYSPQFDDENLVLDVKVNHPSTSSSCCAGNLVSNPQKVGLSASMEQSDSETQKQHKGTICSKDVFGGSPEAFGTPAQVKMMPQNDRQQKISVADVMCSACKQLLFHPVVLNCGHVFCVSCIKNSADETLRCQICQLPHPRGFPKVCLELDHFIEEQFPEEYAKQRDAFQLRNTNNKPETPSSCGHISCFWCVHQSMNPLCESHCPICRNPYYHFPTICWMLHFLLLKMYPVAYKRREIQTLEVEKKEDCYSPQFDDENVVSDVTFDHPSTSSSCYAVNVVSNPQNAGLSASMEQSGSETQKQHKGTMCLKDFFGGSPEAFGTSAQVKMMPPNDGQQKVSVADVMCSACKQLLFHPVVLNCGHVFCESCIKNSANEMLRCQICQLPHPRGLPKVCLELDHFIKEQFPEEYGKQRDALQLRNINDKPETPSCSLNNVGGGKAAWWSDPNSKVHVGVGCDFCGMFPIVGDRYKCKDCKEKVGFDLCADCYKIHSKIPGRFNQQHTPDHEFELMQISVMHNIMRLVTGHLGDGSIENFPLEGIEFRPEDPDLVGDGDGEHTQNDSEGTD